MALELVVQQFQFYQENPQVAQLLNWQRIEKLQHKQSFQFNLKRSDTAQNWLDAIQHYQDKRSINPSKDPCYIVTFILAIISSAALDPLIMFGPTHHIDVYLKFCTQAIMKGLE